MTKNKTVAERLREKPEGRDFECWLAKSVLGFNCSDMLCAFCHDKTANALADMIEAEQDELDKRIEVLESDRDDYIEHVTTFACWQMQIANMLDIPLAERNDSGEVQAKIIAALKERTKTEQNGVDVDALLKLADELEDSATGHYLATRIRDAVKGANASKPMPLPEGIEWPRFEDGELVRFGDKFMHDYPEPPGNNSPLVANCFSFLSDTVCISGYEIGDYGTPVKRPEPEVLDADGVPIKVGDTVWDISGEKEGVVERVGELNTRYGYRNVAVLWPGYTAPYLEQSDQLTHRKPDSMNAINEDVTEFRKNFPPGTTMQIYDFVNRAYKVGKREGGE